MGSESIFIVMIALLSQKIINNITKWKSVLKMYLCGFIGCFDIRRDFYTAARAFITRNRAYHGFTGELFENLILILLTHSE